MAYGGVHVVTGNFTLFGAAGIAGAHWCALYAAGVPLGRAHRQPRDLGHLDLPRPADRRDRAERRARTARGGSDLTGYSGPPSVARAASLAVVRATTMGLVTCPSKRSLMNDSSSSTSPWRSLGSIMFVSENVSISFR